MTGRFAAMTAVLLTVGALAAAAQDCNRSKIEYVREDQNGHRIFARADADALSQKCFGPWLDTITGWLSRDHGDWKHDWSISFFSVAALATYKDDPKIKDHSAWTSSYLGEYDRKRGLMTLYPEDAKRQLHYKVVPKRTR